MSDTAPNHLDWLNSEKEIQSYHVNLIRWGKLNFRPFPWRLTQNPYRILIAEVMLHRTQVKQVLPIFDLFTKKYPDVETLSQARKEELYSDLYSLGLRWRIDFIYEMAGIIVDQFQRRIPKDRGQLLSLPGVSNYIAGATRCFAWNFPEPLADTNTIRVAGRVFGLEIKPSSRRNRVFRDLLSKLLSLEHPRDYNYALLDLADKVCTKKNKPDCSICPILQFCKYDYNKTIG